MRARVLFCFVTFWFVLFCARVFSFAFFFEERVFWFFEEGKESSSAFERRGEERRGGGNPLFFSLFVMKTKKYLITHREKETLFY